MDTERQRRVARNEALFRELNEELRRRVDEFDGEARTYTLMCECAETGCTEMVAVNREEYQRARADDRCFLVLPEHLVPDAESPVHKHDHHWVIKKHGPAGDEAARRSLR